MTYFIQIIFKIKIFCIKIAWFSHFTKTVTFKASKSPVFVFFWRKIAILIQSPKSCACVSPVIIHVGSLFFAYRYVFSKLLYIPNSCFWIVCMCFLLFCTYLILVFELSACISWFFAYTRFLFFNFLTCILKCSA